MMRIKDREKYAGIKNILKAVTMLALICLLPGCALTGKGHKEDAVSGWNEGQDYQGSQEESEDALDYELKTVKMDQKEADDARGKLIAQMEKCKGIYTAALAEGSDEERKTSGGGKAVSAGNDGTVVVDGVIFPEETVHEMIETAAADGCSITCGSRDYNMTNYEKIDAAIRRAEEGEDAEAEFYQINTIGVFRYYRLEFHEKELTVTFLSASFDEAMEIYIQQMEKVAVYRWEYTKKGWLIWEKALTRNQEMDMHIFYRILPLDVQCRDMMEHYIVPVSYLSNNLFLEDWAENSLEKIEFNDLFDYLYEMATGKILDEEVYSGGIPKEEFEAVIQQYFDIRTEEIEAYAGYDAAKGRYPWSAVHALNRVQQIQPFPEVVRCEEKEGGILKVYVEAIYIEEGTDYSFGHMVTFRRTEDGRLVYAGNQVDRENARLIPGYRPRRELETR